MDSNPAVIVALIGLAGTLVTTVGAVVAKWLEYKGEREKSRAESSQPEDARGPLALPKSAAQRKRKRRSRRWTHFMLAFILLMTAGGVAIKLQQSYVVLDAALRITYPAPNAEVSLREEVEGDYENLPDGQVVWVFVFSHASGRYYPQNNAADLQPKGRWTSLTYFGVETDHRQTFSALAVLANPKGQTFIKNYLATARDRNDWPGMDRLPEGVTEYDRVKVVRR